MTTTHPDTPTRGAFTAPPPARAASKSPRLLSSYEMERAADPSADPAQYYPDRTNGKRSSLSSDFESDSDDPEMEEEISSLRAKISALEEQCKRLSSRRGDGSAPPRKRRRYHPEREAYSYDARRDADYLGSRGAQLIRDSEGGIRHARVGEDVNDMEDYLYAMRHMAGLPLETIFPNRTRWSLACSVLTRLITVAAYNELAYRLRGLAAEMDRDRALSPERLVALLCRVHRVVDEEGGPYPRQLHRVDAGTILSVAGQDVYDHLGLDRVFGVSSQPDATVLDEEEFRSDNTQPPSPRHDSLPTSPGEAFCVPIDDEESSELPAPPQAAPPAVSAQE